VSAWHENHVSSIDIYNYGLMPGVMWDAVGDALKGSTS
jgi:hypothetical protein